MNETEIKWREQLLKSLANIIDHTSSEYEIISNGVKTISFLEQENEKLKERIEYLERSNNRREDTILEQRQEISDLEDNWNKLKEFIKKSLEAIDTIQKLTGNVIENYTPRILTYKQILDKMQELRQGSDEQ